MSAPALFEATPESLRTERLCLRPLEERDLDTLVRLLAEREVAHFMASLPFPYTRADAKAFLEKSASDPAHRVYAMADGEDGLLGIISLSDLQDGRPPQLGYWIGKPFWGQAFASEALKGLLEAIAAIGRIACIGARVLQENPASRRVLEKNGFLVVEETTSIVERHRGKPLLIMQRTLR